MPTDSESSIPKAVRTIGWTREAPEFQPLGAVSEPASDASKLGSFVAIPPAELSSWVDRMHRAGIVADRRNSPDLYGQLGQAMRRPVDTALCGALDSDPSACLNSALAAQYPIELAAGMTIIGRITRARRAAVIVDSQVPSNWFSQLRRYCAVTAIAVQPIVNDYPQADPTLMLYALLGRRLRPGRLPTDQGVVLIDAAAAIAVGRYALLDEKMLNTPLVVRDHAAGESFYLSAPVGSTLTEIFQNISLSLQGQVVRAGDLLRDMRAAPDSIIGGGELVFHSAPESPPVNPSPCIRCGWCVDSCPTRVQPAIALEASQRDDVQLAEHAGIDACIQCGICSYVCPSQLPLLEGIRRMEIMLKQAHGDHVVGQAPNSK